MRALATSLVVGAVVVVGLAAAVDVLRSEPRPAPTAEQRQSPRPAALVAPPRIEGRAGRAAELRALGAEGVLYLTDRACRRWILRLPELEWSTREAVPGPRCDRRPVVNRRGDVAALESGRETIDVFSAGWGHRFRGRSPAFKPDGTLTFVRDGRLHQWTGRCREGAPRVTFRGEPEVDLCVRPVETPLERLEEVVWLGQHAFAAVAGPPDRASALIASGRRVRVWLRTAGIRLDGVEASPHGRYVAVRLGGDVEVFDVERGETVALPTARVRALAWSPDDRFVAAASESFVFVARSGRGEAGAVLLPLAVRDVEWR